jgi:hypothetical protein
VVFYLAESSFGNLHFLNDELGYAGGRMGRGDCAMSIFIKTTDGGLSWSQHTISGDPPYCTAGYRVSSIYTLNEQTMFFAQTQWRGYLSYTGIYKTIDGGDSWRQVRTDIDGYVHFAFKDSLTGFGVGGSGWDSGAFVYRTLDGGESWPMIFYASGGIFSMKAIKFLNDAIAYAVGDVRYFLKTTDGGDTWSIHETGKTDRLVWLNDLAVLNDSTVVAVGESDDTTWIVVGVYSVLRSENGGESWDIYPNVLTVAVEASDPHPQQYRLYPAYPNPFNPVTTIRYDLPHASEVSLVIYDLLGREVARLMDDYQEPGYHEVQWNGRSQSDRSLPSGIYIARLITPGYYKSIKMVLLK